MVDCRRFLNEEMIMEIHGYICGPRLYEFDGWFFELSGYGGPWPLRKDGELRKRAGRKFWEMWTRFDALTEAEQEAFRVGGGCEQF
jgi:hypothetical protein